MEFNQNPMQNQTKVSPPPSPEVSVRTLQTDRASIAKGDPTPVPQVVSPAGFDAVAPAFTPPAPNDPSSIVMEETVKPKSKKGLWIIISLVILAGLFALGYFVIYPMLSGPAEPAPAPEAVTEPTPTPPPAPPVVQHVSYFTTAPAFFSKAALDPVSGANAQATLVAQAQVAPMDAITEISLTDTAGSRLASDIYLKAITPSFAGATPLEAMLESDFTTFLYRNDKGVWPGYVFKKKTEATAAGFSQWASGLETATLAEFYTNVPGAFQAFKSGTIGTVADRYASGENGASFSYAVVDDYLVIATNFEGMKAALGLLGK